MVKKTTLTEKMIIWLSGLKEQDLDNVILKVLRGDGKEFKEIFMSDLVRTINKKYPELNANQPYVTSRVDWLKGFEYVDVFEKENKKFVRLTSKGNRAFVFIFLSKKEMIDKWKKIIGDENEKTAT